MDESTVEQSATDTQPEPGRMLFVALGVLRMRARSRHVPNRRAARAARGRADRLKHHGSTFGTREPCFERRGRLTRRKPTKSGDVSKRGAESP